MAKTTEQLARLTAIAGDESHPLHRTAQAALRKLACAQSTAKQSTVHQRADVQRYRVGGVWKLTERIADFDVEGDVTNGYSDSTGTVSHGRTLRPQSDYSAPALAPEPKYPDKPGWAGVLRNAADDYRAHGIVD